MKKLSKTLFFVLNSFVVLFFLPCTSKTSENILMNSSDPFTFERTSYINVLMSMSENDYKPLKSISHLMGIAVFESVHWEDEVFKKNFRTEEFIVPCKLTYHLASEDKVDFDLIRRWCKNQDFIFEIIESSQFLYLQIDTKKYRENDNSKLNIASDIATTFLNTDPLKLKFKIVAGDKYPVFSSNQFLSFTAMKNWDDRIDGILFENSIVLIIYKTHVDLESYTDLKEWFSGVSD